MCQLKKFKNTCIKKPWMTLVPWKKTLTKTKHASLTIDRDQDVWYASLTVDRDQDVWSSQENVMRVVT